MDQALPSASARPLSIMRHPLYSMLLPVPVVCFLGALLTDIAYLNSGGNLVWLDFSNWLLLAGLVFGVLAAIVVLIDVLRGRGFRAGGGWVQLVVLCAALLVELFNSFVHDRDGWTAVAGTGILLSIVGALLVLVAGWLHRPAGWEPVR